MNEALRSCLADESTLAGPTPRELQSGKRNPLPLLPETLGLVQQESAYSDLIEQEGKWPGEVD
jgi:hypothetical protein